MEGGCRDFSRSTDALCLCVCVWVGGLNSINLASNEMSSANPNVTERLVSSKNSQSLGGGT